MNIMRCIINFSFIYIKIETAVAKGTNKSNTFSIEILQNNNLHQNMYLAHIFDVFSIYLLRRKLLRRTKNTALCPNV